jgi:quaternary ammonium compound-resistance protein SugE
MDWLYLLLAGVLEIGWATGIKYTDGFSKLTPSLITIFLMVLSFGALSIAMRTIPLGTAYAIWSGIGAVGVAALGVFYFNEPSDIARIISILLIVGGIVGLKLASG